MEITAGDSIAATFLPKCTNIAVFPQANSGAEEAAAELGSDPAEFVGPADCGDTTGQIEFMTNAVTQGVDAIMLSNNSGDQLDAPAQAAADAGIPVVTWDSPIPSATGESVFVAQVDFDETGQVMADMARNILGDDGGQFAILSATPDAANQNAWIEAMEEVLAGPEYANLELVETVYGNDVAEDSVTAALGLVDSHPDLELIMAPTTVGIVAAAQAMTQEGSVRDDQGLRSRPPRGDGALCRERMCSGVRTCGASSTSGTSPITWHTGLPPGRSRLRKAQPSSPVAWASTRSRPTRHEMPGCGC